MISKFSKIAAVGALTAAIAAGASAPAFAADKTQNALIGAAVGALAGSLLSHGNTGAVVAGAAVGGIVGASAGHDHDRRYVADYRRYEPAPSYGRAYYRPAYRSYEDSYYAPVRYAPTYGYAHHGDYARYGY